MKPALQLAMLTVVAAAGSYSRFIFSAVQEPARIALHLSDNQISVLQGPAVALPLMVGCIPLGLAVDRCSRQRLILLFTILEIAANGMAALASGFFLLCILRAVVWLAMSGMILAVLSISADLFAPTSRGRALMIVSIGQVAGTSLAFALGGHLLSMVGPGQAAWRWSVGCLTLVLVPALIAVLGLREPARIGVETELAGTHEVVGELWKYRGRILTLLVGGVLVAMVDNAMEVWSAPMFTRTFGLSPAEVGTLMGVGLLLSGVVGPIAGGVLADHSLRTGGARRVVGVLAGLAMLSAPAGLFAIMPGATWAGLLFASLYTTVSAVGVVVATMYTVVVPNELRGLCMGISNVIAVPVSVGLAPLAVTAVSGRMGGGDKLGVALAIVCASVSVMGAGAFRFGARFFPSAEARC